MEKINTLGAIMKREFSLTHTVRYDECNCDGLLTPPAFVRYMQELAARDAEDAQLSGDGYWVVKRTVISFAAPVPVHTPLVLKTYGLGLTRITAQRGDEAPLVAEPPADPQRAGRKDWLNPRVSEQGRFVAALGRDARGGQPRGL